jgi:hypothetical protein
MANSGHFGQHLNSLPTAEAVSLSRMSNGEWPQQKLHNWHAIEAVR